jgi:hypothetical protein
MATTTNYGWTTPDDTALVKDGAAAIRTLGSSVDTTTKNLNPETTLGDIAYRSSTANVKTRLGIGTTGQVLAVSGGVPAWTTPTSGGVTLISETVASALSGLSLSSIPSTYKHLVLTWHGIEASIANSSGFIMRFNNDSTANIYRGQMTYTTGSAVNHDKWTYDDATRAVAIGVAPFGWNSTANSNLQENPCGSMTIYNYASTSKFKFYELKWYFNSSGNAAFTAHVQANYATTSAITSIDIIRSGGSATFSNTADTSIRLYGVS